MKIGIIGYQRSGKSTLLEWLTGVTADPALSHTSQSAMAVVPEPRVEPLCSIYKPKKITQAAIELVDTPGLSRDHAGSGAKLALIREAGCLIQVIGAFDGSNDPAHDLRNLYDDFLLADLEIVTNRVERLREALKKPRPNREEQAAELEAIEPILAHLEAGLPLREMTLRPEQQLAIRSFSLLTQKPRMAIFNLGDDAADAERWQALATSECAVAAVPISFELELSKMEPDERDLFRREMGG
ncbi:MAG TPA: GTPase, partial [Pirellulaceae bacterium]